MSYKDQEEIPVLVYIDIFLEFSSCLYFSSLISVTVTSTLTKSNTKRKGFIWLTVPGYNQPLLYHTHSQRQGDNVSLPLILFSISLLGNGAAYSWPGLPASLLKAIPQMCPQANLIEAVCSRLT